MIYAKVGESFQQIGGSCPSEYVQMQGERPTPNHVAQADGTWVLPEIKQELCEKVDQNILDLAEAVLELSNEIEKIKGSGV